MTALTSDKAKEEQEEGSVCYLLAIRPEENTIEPHRTSEMLGEYFRTMF